MITPYEVSKAIYTTTSTIKEFDLALRALGSFTVKQLNEVEEIAIQNGWKLPIITKRV